jgi:hypothetical protein
MRFYQHDIYLEYFQTIVFLLDNDYQKLQVSLMILLYQLIEYYRLVMVFALELNLQEIKS